MESMTVEGIIVRPTLVNLNSVQVGDTVLHNGKLLTVSKSDINRDHFMGLSIFGDSYHIKRKIIKCSIFNGLRFN
jgi:hypothetical protein